MKKIVVLFIVLFALMGNAFAAEPVTTPIAEPAANAVQVEAERKPLKIALITIGSYKIDNKRVYTDDIAFFMRLAPMDTSHITPYTEIPAITILDPTSLLNPKTLVPLAGELGVDRIIVFDAPAAPLAKKGPYKGAYVGDFRAYVIEKTGEIIADYTKTRVVMRDVDSEKIKTPPDVIRYEIVKDQETWQKKCMQAVYQFLEAYIL